MRKRDSKRRVKARIRIGRWVSTQDMIERGLMPPPHYRRRYLSEMWAPAVMVRVSDMELARWAVASRQQIPRWAF